MDRHICSVLLSGPADPAGSTRMSSLLRITSDCQQETGGEGRWATNAGNEETKD